MKGRSPVSHLTDGERLLSYDVSLLSLLQPRDALLPSILPVTLLAEALTRDGRHTSSSVSATAVVTSDAVEMDTRGQSKLSVCSPPQQV